MMRRRGIVLPSFEIYGGVSGLIDYGPVGARIKRRVVESWVDHWTSQGDVVEIDSPSITPKEVLVASGHVGEFNDHMSECISCEGIFRSDHLIEGRHPNPDSISGRIPVFRIPEPLPWTRIRFPHTWTPFPMR